MNVCIFFLLTDLHTTHQTNTLFGTRNSSLANTKIYMLLYRYCFVLLCISKYKPSRAYIRRADLT